MKHTSKILALVLVVMTVIMSLSAITASAAEATHTFDCTTMTFVSDKGAVSGDYDDYFKFEGTVTMRGSDSKGVTSVELDKNSNGSITFTTVGPAKVTISFSSTRGSNNSFIVLVDSEGNALGNQVEVVGTTFIDTTYDVPAAGTYKVVNPSSSRTTRVKTVVVEDIAVCEHIYEDGACTLCGEVDPSACQHTNTSLATCTAPEKCLDCDKELSEALGHTAGAEATCTTAQTCTVCGDELAPKLGHTLTFVNTLPVLGTPGKTTADCSVCGEHLDFGEVNVMTGGTYELDAADLAGIAQYSLFDGEVKVVDGVFACHLSNKYYTQDGRTETFTALQWNATHRLNLQGSSEFLNNGTGDEAVRNGGLKNYIQIVTTEATTITIAWGIGDAGREMAVYDMEGNLVAVTEEMGAKNDLAVSTLTVPAGAYIIGTYFPEGVKSGGNYIYKIIVDVEIPHVCEFAPATCTAPATCECGATQGEALGHTWVDATCTDPKTCSVCGETEGEALGHEYVDGKCACGAEDPDYVAPVEPQPEEPKEEPAPKLNFFQKIIAWFVELFNKIIGFFKK